MRTLPAVLLSIWVSLSMAQPSLTPPAGAVQPSERFGVGTPISAATTPGDDNSFFKITEPGLYYLPRNISLLQNPFGPTRELGIELAADNITIDFNGFVLQAISDISVAIGADNTLVELAVIKNGSIDGFRACISTDGLVSSGAAIDTRVIDIRMTPAEIPGTKTYGILSEFTGLVAEDCSVIASEGEVVGIKVFVGIVRGCTVRSTSTGIDAARSVVKACQVSAFPPDGAPSADWIVASETTVSDGRASASTGGFTFRIATFSVARGCQAFPGTAFVTSNSTAVDCVF